MGTQITEVRREGKDLSSNCHWLLRTKAMTKNRYLENEEELEMLVTEK